VAGFARTNVRARLEIRRSAAEEVKRRARVISA
jgi:hypothetical protein